MGSILDVAYITAVTFSPTEECGKNFLFNLLHDAGLDPVVRKKKGQQKDPIENLSYIVKDHNNNCVRDFIKQANVFILSHIRDEENNFISTAVAENVVDNTTLVDIPCRYVYINLRLLIHCCGWTSRYKIYIVPMSPPPPV